MTQGLQLVRTVVLAQQTNNKPTTQPGGLNELLNYHSEPAGNTETFAYFTGVPLSDGVIKRGEVGSRPKSFLSHIVVFKMFLPNVHSSTIYNGQDMEAT